MHKIQFEKVVGSLPATINPNTLYFLRTGKGFSLFLSDSSGDAVKKMNSDYGEIVNAQLLGLSDDDVGKADSDDSILSGISKINNTAPMIYDSNGIINKPKIFVGKTTATDGDWTINYEHVGFTHVIGVDVTPEAVGTATADRRVAGVNKESLTTTGCAGYLLSSSSAGLLAAMTLITASGPLYVTVYGY